MSVNNASASGILIRGGTTGSGFVEAGGGTGPYTATLTRYTATYTFTNASTQRVTFRAIVNGAVGDVLDVTLRLAAPQLELGSFLTSYIPTTSAAVTRAADNFTLSTGSWFNGNAGTWFAYFDGGKESSQSIYGRVVSPEGVKTILSTDCGATSQVGTWEGTGSLCKNSGIDFYTTPGGAAMSYDQSILTRSITARGLAPVTGAYGVNYNSSGTIGIGRNAASASNMLNGHIQKVRFYPQRVANSQLQLLSQ